MKYYKIRVYTGAIPGLGEQPLETTDDIYFATSSNYNVVEMYAEIFCSENAHKHISKIHNDLSFDEWYDKICPHLSCSQAMSRWDRDIDEYINNKWYSIKEISYDIYNAYSNQQRGDCG